MGGCPIGHPLIGVSMAVAFFLGFLLVCAAVVALVNWFNQDS